MKKIQRKKTKGLQYSAENIKNSKSLKEINFIMKKIII